MTGLVRGLLCSQEKKSEAHDIEISTRHAEEDGLVVDKEEVRDSEPQECWAVKPDAVSSRVGCRRRPGMRV